VVPPVVPHKSKNAYAGALDLANVDPAVAHALKVFLALTPEARKAFLAHATREPQQ
jgi:hypothetical protein